MNTFIRVPKKGDIVVRVKATAEQKYYKLDGFALSDVDTNTYEVIGVVVCVKNGKVLWVYKDNATKVWCNRAWWHLSGFTLDGAEHTGVISIRVVTDNWAANVDKTITYTATTTAEMVAELNTAFAADTDFTAQDWYADVISGEAAKVRVHCNLSAYQQLSYNTASGGFTLSTSLPEITYSSVMLHKNGASSGGGSISNMARALTYFASDNSASSYNPMSALTSIKTIIPVCYPAYIGHSEYRKDGETYLDHCAVLRAKYGEGEDGWHRYMEAQRPVVPSDKGVMRVDNGGERTRQLASYTYTSATQATPKAMCAAADYANTIASTTITAGELHLPTPEEIHDILDGVLYGTNASRNADPLNKGLNAIGGTAISNSAHVWSCVRFDDSNALNANGSVGFFHSKYMTVGSAAVTVSLTPLS